MAHIVLLHGFCEHSGMWTSTKRYLTNQGHSVHTIDLPGFGSNHQIEESISGMAQYVVEYCKSQHIASAIFLGHSLGGYVVLDILAHFSNYVQGVGMIHSHAQADDVLKIENRKKLISFVEKHGTEPFLKDFSRQLVSEEVTDQGILRRVFELVKNAKSNGVIAATKAMIGRSDYRMLLSTFNVPFLWLIGQKDSFIQLDEILIQAANCQRSMVEVLQGVGHLSVYENPEEANRIIGDFVSWVIETNETQ